MNHVLFLLKYPFAWANSNKCAHSTLLLLIFAWANSFFLFIYYRKKIFAHAKIDNNNKVEGAHLLLFAHANGYFNRNNTWFI